MKPYPLHMLRGGGWIGHSSCEAWRGYRYGGWPGLRPEIYGFRIMKKTLMKPYLILKGGCLWLSGFDPYDFTDFSPAKHKLTGGFRIVRRTV